VKVSIVIGTPPELIKMSPVMKELLKRGVPFSFIHSNQHYSKEMDGNIIKNLNLPPIDSHLHVGSGSHATQTGKVMSGVEDIWLNDRPDLVIVHGDTNTTVGAALTAAKLQLPVAHVEAGLRSFDNLMPEEINRILTDHMSSLLFAPTTLAKQHLIKEGISKGKIIVTGNTVVDALNQHLDMAIQVLGKEYIEEGQKYMLVTAHRPENVDSKEQAEKLFHLLQQLSDKTGLKIIWPMHPRTKKNFKEFHISIPKKLGLLIPPVDYFTMLRLINSAQLVVTDSGGIQEEAFILKKPLITIRTSTERPETLSANFIVSLNIDLAMKAWNKYERNEVTWKQTLGKGNAARLIVDSIQTFLEKRSI